MPADIRANVTPIPKGPLKAKQAMQLMVKLRRSELSNARAVNRGRKFYDTVRREYGRPRKK